MRTRERTAYGAAVFYVLTTSAALACPLAANLDTGGVQFTEADGSVDVYRRLDAERLEGEYISPDFPEVSRSVLINGIFVQGFASFIDGELVVESIGQVRRAMTPAEMPVPVAGLTWSVAQVFEDATSRVEETLTIEVGAEETLLLGDCSYTLLPVTVTIRASDGVFEEQIHYLPELGVGLLAGFTDNTGTTTYEYVDIAVVTP